MTDLSDNSTGDHKDGAFCSAKQRRYVLAAAILASALGFIDGSIVSIAIPAIRENLGANFVQAQWISNAYALTLSALILIGGAAGDHYGLRNTFIFGIALFVIASIGCAAAPDPEWLIAARAVQGIGAAVMTPTSLAIIAKAYPKSERGRAIGIWAASSALTTALGPVIGGAALSYFEPAVWRAIFAVNLPLGALAIFLLAAKTPADARGPQTRLDLVGAGLAVIGFGALAYGLTAASGAASSASWTPEIVSLGGLFVISVFALWEWRQPSPMVNLRLFTSRGVAGANLATFFLYFSLSAIMFYLPMLIIAGWGKSETLAGLSFVPLSIAIALLSGLVGKLADRIGPRLPISIGSLIVGLALACLAISIYSGVNDFWLGVMPAMAGVAIGMSLVVSPLSTAVMTSVADADTGAASGINNAVSRIAGLIAVAAMGALASRVYQRVAEGMAADAAPLPSFGEIKTGLSPQLEAARLAGSNSAFFAVALTSAIFCLIAAGFAYFMLRAQPQQKAD